MKRLSLCVLLLFGISLLSLAETLSVKQFRHSGPYPVRTPLLIDTVNVKSEPFQAVSACGRISFDFENSRFAPVTVHIEGAVKEHQLFVDGKAAGGTLKLDPGTHRVEIKYLLGAGEKPSLDVSLETPEEGILSLREDGRHRYGMKDVLLGTRVAGVALSPDGRWLITSYTTTREGGRTERFYTVSETATGRVLTRTGERLNWMPRSGKYYFTRKEVPGTRLLAVDPATGQEEILAEDIPEGPFQFSPAEDALFYMMHEDGPAERENIYQILSPDDRQPGWRSRSYPARYDLATGVVQRLAYGYHNVWLSDISQDGAKALLLVSEERLEKRPTTVYTLYLMDLASLKAEKLVDRDGFMQSAAFSPDGRQVLLSGSPEAFGGIGMNVRKGQTPSMTDIQLYLMDLATRKIRPLTRDFDPCVSASAWSLADGQIYLTAENRDRIDLFRIDPRSGRIRQVETPEDLVKGFSLASQAPAMAWYGQGASNSDRVYLADTRSGKSTLREDLSAEILRDVVLGECRAWNFKNSKGETVYGRFYLPPDFDPSKKYPMIVNYYGGCSPTSRNFESRYPHHAYAALGYVVYVVALPSGATGNGQAWSARHVNTAGDGPAQDIIEGTEQFCREHPFVNPERIGCIGASYGGFMSQYIPTLTDRFACAISHAGISDHTSYWGFGYWGYSYSETSMANSYPWSDRELYVDHSPLYLADKINTPILLIHGDADTNVPFNESIQLFTALKLLGKETALVAVKDQNHHILDYAKRLDWQNTIWAWFAKYLQDDPAWWDALYPPKAL
ncbi:MAG: S9 family peptidase [Bacteroidales bacterium]|nr:S9 family peptidase [Bacteroidales bacterium]